MSGEAAHDPAEQSPIASAIRDLVATAKARGGLLRTGECARRMALENPDCAMSLREIAQEVALQAVRAGVPIQFTSVD